MLGTCGVETPAGDSESSVARSEGGSDESKSVVFMVDKEDDGKSTTSTISMERKRLRCVLLFGGRLVIRLQLGFSLTYGTSTCLGRFRLGGPGVFQAECSLEKLSGEIKCRENIHTRS